MFPLPPTQYCIFPSFFPKIKVYLPFLLFFPAFCNLSRQFCPAFSRHFLYSLPISSCIFLLFLISWPRFLRSLAFRYLALPSVSSFLWLISYFLFSFKFLRFPHPLFLIWSLAYIPTVAKVHCQKGFNSGTVPSYNPIFSLVYMRVMSCYLFMKNKNFVSQESRFI